MSNMNARIKSFKVCDNFNIDIKPKILFSHVLKKDTILIRMPIFVYSARIEILKYAVN